MNCNNRCILANIRLFFMVHPLDRKVFLDSQQNYIPCKIVARNVSKDSCGVLKYRELVIMMQNFDIHMG